MYREITLHDLQVRVYRDGKTIQVLRIVRCIKLKNYSTIQGLCKKFKISKPSYYRIKKAHFL